MGRGHLYQGILGLEGAQLKCVKHSLTPGWILPCFERPYVSEGKGIAGRRKEQNGKELYTKVKHLRSP